VLDCRSELSSMNFTRQQADTVCGFSEKDQTAKVAQTSDRQITKKKDMDEMFVKKSGH